MTNSIKAAFNSDRKLLGCYLLGGNPDNLPRQAEIYYESGVDFVEFGLPSADPFLDGPVIKEAMARVLGAGVGPEEISSHLLNIRRIFKNRPIVAVSYGSKQLAELQQHSDQPLVDAFLDLLEVTENPAEPRPRPIPSSLQGVSTIGFVSHALTAEDIDRAKRATSYIMLQATSGKTGNDCELEQSGSQKIEQLRSLGINLPILLGIGVSTNAHVSAVLNMGADGVIIGTRCLVEASQGEDSLRDFLTQIRETLDA